jgi:hypothetical protein
MPKQALPGLVTAARAGDLRSGLSALRFTVGCGATTYLAHQHLVSRDERERRPRGDHPACCRRLGGSDVRREARHAPDCEQGPRQNPAAAHQSAGRPVGWLALRRSSRPPAAASALPPTPAARSTNRCICRKETVPAISSSSATLPVVIHRIHRPGRPVTAALRRRPFITGQVCSFQAAMAASLPGRQRLWTSAPPGHRRPAPAATGSPASASPEMPGDLPVADPGPSRLSENSCRAPAKSRDCTSASNRPRELERQRAIGKVWIPLFSDTEIPPPLP